MLIYNKGMTMREVITRINYFRLEKGISAAELSFRVGKSASYVSKLESVGIIPPSNILLKLIEALGIEPEEFFAKDYRNYRKNILIGEEYEKLSDDQKQVVLSVLRNFRK